jgi:hypothetical protein
MLYSVKLGATTLIAAFLETAFLEGVVLNSLSELQTDMLMTVTFSVTVIIYP